MLGASHREKAERAPVFGADKVRRIDSWYKRERSDGTVYYEHHLTGQKRSELPAGAVVDPASQGGSGVSVDNGLAELGWRRSTRESGSKKPDNRPRIVG